MPAAVSRATWVVLKIKSGSFVNDSASHTRWASKRLVTSTDLENAFWGFLVCVVLFVWCQSVLILSIWLLIFSDLLICKPLAKKKPVWCR